MGGSGAARPGMRERSRLRTGMCPGMCPGCVRDVSRDVSPLGPGVGRSKVPAACGSPEQSGVVAHRGISSLAITGFREIKHCGHLGRGHFWAKSSPALALNAFDLFSAPEGALPPAVPHRARLSSLGVPWRCGVSVEAAEAVPGSGAQTRLCSDPFTSERTACYQRHVELLAQDRCVRCVTTAQHEAVLDIQTAATGSSSPPLCAQVICTCFCSTEPSRKGKRRSLFLGRFHSSL